MPAPFAAPTPLAIERSPWLRGALHVPGDAAIAQLAVVCGALATGETVLAGAPAIAALPALAAALGRFGVSVEADGSLWRINGLGVRGLLEPDAPLELAEAPLALELMLGIAAGYDFATEFAGRGPLPRQTGALLDLLGGLGVAHAAGDPVRLPLSLRGPALLYPPDLELPAQAPGLLAPLLFAALHARGTSRFRAVPAGLGPAARMLRTFGARLAITGDGVDRAIELEGLPELRARGVAVPGDPSLAAVVAAAAAMVPGSDVVVEAVLVDPDRTVVLSALIAMGAEISLEHVREDRGERIGDLCVRHRPLHANTFAAPHVALLADDLPLLAAAAAVADGDSIFALPRDMALLQRARLADLAASLRALGVEAAVNEEALAIRGTSRVRGGRRIVTEADAGIGVAPLLLGMVADEQVTIDDQGGIEERFPGFAAAFEAIGASLNR